VHCSLWLVAGCGKTLLEEFVKALTKTGNCFKYLSKTFPRMSEATLKEGVLVGRDIRKTIFDEYFLLTMTEVERERLG
jgi:hypothetical protein